MTIKIEEKTDLEVSAELLANVPDTYQKNVGYFLWDLMLAIGKVFVSLWNRLRYLSCFVANIEQLDYADLVKFIYQRSGIVAKTATKSSGLLTIHSTDVVNISIGDMFESANGLQFVSTEEKTLNNGESFNVECTVFGSVGNVPVGVVNVISKPITNLVAVTNDAVMSGGFEDETKESLLERYYIKLQQPISSGNIYHYMQWALECTGVGKAKVKPLWNGENTVKVIIADSNNEIANEKLVADVQAYIDPYVLEGENKIGWGCGNGQAPIGAYCTIESALKKDINVTVAVKLKAGTEFDAVKNSIETEIKKYLKSLVFIDDAYVSYSKINSVIVNADGVEDLADLTINDDTNNILISETDTDCELAMLNTLIVTEIEEV